MKSAYPKNLAIYKLSRSIAKTYVRFKYGFKCDKRIHLTEPTLVLSNHTTECDMILVGTSFYEPFSIVCGEHLLRSKIGHIYDKYMSLIPTCKGASHLPMIKQLTKRLKNGENIMLFPEGSRSFNGITTEVNSSIGKLVKISGCALATFHMEGGYFIAPRWAYHFRKGPMCGEVKHLISSEELKAMSAAEITDLINKDLYENAYETQRIRHDRYRCDGLAEGIENYLIKCPCCGSYDSFTSKGDIFTCTECGVSGRYNEEGFLEPVSAGKNGKSISYDSVADWGAWEEMSFHEEMFDKPADELLFTDTDVKLYSIDPEAHTSCDIASDTLYIYADRFVFAGKEYLYNDISEAAMLYYGKSLLFTHTDGYFGLTGEHFHAIKVSWLYRIYMEKYNPKKIMNAL